MKLRILAAALALLSTSVHAAADYSILDRIPGGDGSYDYISFDAAHGLVFVGRETGVMKIDLATRKVSNEFVKGEDVAAVQIIPDSPLMLSTNGEANRATLFDRLTGQIKAQIPTGKGPDGALYDAGTGLAFVMNSDSQDVTLIDVKQGRAVGTVALGGGPEAAAADGAGHLYVNIEDASEIAAVDVKTRKVTARYKLPKCSEPTGIQFDSATGLLVTVCRNGIAKVVDAKSGADKGTVAIGQGADGVIVDAERRLVYVPCNEGVLSIFALGTDGKIGAVKNVPTQHFARTAALDPKSGNLYLPVNKREKAGEDKWKALPGTFEVLVVGPR